MEILYVLLINRARPWIWGADTNTSTLSHCSTGAIHRNNRVLLYFKVKTSQNEVVLGRSGLVGRATDSDHLCIEEVDQMIDCERFCFVTLF